MREGKHRVEPWINPGVITSVCTCCRVAVEGSRVATGWESVAISSQSRGMMYFILTVVLY